MSTNNIITIGELVCDPFTFSPSLPVYKNGDPWFAFNLELAQDKLAGGMTVDEAQTELISVCQNQYPDFKDEVVEAFNLILARARKVKESNTNLPN